MDMVWLNVLYVVTNGLIMFIAAWRPDSFGGGVMARLVFTLNFIAVLVHWSAMAKAGVV
ncbi:putative membrane protein [Pectobacterium phage vB_PatM_CB7]|nr:putative membrane protein [Pectobacterium phage vB_PatM_CB7]